eukprot:NODE_2553_length_583_cov_244.477528_g2181_i0.p1 GENE.NODE_2553_length_583_cov_244.477528_g2181_i0~~NODE_2553_length_583_cov_244.477528_g2181_i0.p1  ORF type:complete len:96 (+),score=7.13 NODE_2553_length_583_cov_244.477528_g2181_i0:29-316(+)
MGRFRVYPDCIPTTQLFNHSSAMSRAEMMERRKQENLDEMSRKFGSLKGSDPAAGQYEPEIDHAPLRHQQQPDGIGALPGMNAQEAPKRGKRRVG